MVPKIIHEQSTYLIFIHVSEVQWKTCNSYLHIRHEKYANSKHLSFIFLSF